MRYGSRKYIDLIREAESKWANWDPDVMCEVGDFGEIDKETGEFRTEGNIFKGYIKEAELPKSTSTPNDVVHIQSSSARKIDLSVGPKVDVLGVVDATVQGKWKFSNRRGAVLLMVAPRHTYIRPSNSQLQKLLLSPELKDKVLVTNVVMCLSYALYLSTKDGDEISLALSASGPIPQVPGLTAGGDASTSLESSSSSGTLKQGGHKDEYKFTPLFTLKTIKKPWWKRGGPPPDPNGEDSWKDVTPPWNALNDDGESEDEPVADDDVPDW